MKRLINLLLHRENLETAPGNLTYQLPLLLLGLPCPIPTPPPLECLVTDQPALEKGTSKSAL